MEYVFAWLKEHGFSSVPSGIIGAAATLLGRELIDKLKSPRLRLVLPGILIPCGEEYWGRILVENKGKSAAKNARIIARRNGLEHQNEILDMPWSDLDATFEITIPAGTSRYFDIFCINGRKEAWFVARNNNRQLYKVNEFTFFVTSENSKAKTRNVSIIISDEYPFALIA